MFCYQKSFANPTLPVDEAQFYALVRAEQWNENIDKYRETHDAALKRKLPAFIFQATFDETTSKAGKIGRWRKQSATRLTGLVVMDIDHIEDPKAVFEGWGETELRNHGVLLVYITPSGRGLKIVFKARHDWGNLIDNQHAMAKVLGVEVDESCKDASRMSFICKETDILYLDKELFTYEDKEFAERYDAVYRDGHSAAEKSAVVNHEGKVNQQGLVRDSALNHDPVPRDSSKANSALNHDPVPHDSSRAAINFDDVTFRYATGDREILSHFTHHFQSGTKTAIMGETGIGKSASCNPHRAVSRWVATSVSYHKATPS